MKNNLSQYDTEESKSEIAACAAVKSKACAFGEIVRFAHGEMKSVPHPAQRDFTVQRFHPPQADFILPQGRISLKNP